MKSNLKRIYEERSKFYKCEPALFQQPGLKLIPEEKLKSKKVITIASIDKHLLLRFDPKMDFPFKEFKKINQSSKSAVLKFLAEYFAKDNLVLNEPFYYFYKLDNKLPVSRVKDLKIRQISEADYPAMNDFFKHCSEEDLDDADIDLDEPDPVIFCGFYDNQIVAYASHRYFPEGIADIGVLIHPDHRKKGYGLDVVSHDTRWCLDNNIIPMYRVWENNIGSVSLVKKLGFTCFVEVYRLEKPKEN